MNSTDDPGNAPEPDSNQLPLEDTLVDRGVDDILDEGYSPPDWPHSHRWGETSLEEAEGEPFEERLAQELPDDAPNRQPDRAGRLAADEDGEAIEVGVAGGGAGAEEAAMHITDGTGTSADQDDQDGQSEQV
ncbi:DUF5709 domain-containing protein [Ruania halotolerans]|uniref:DUF5709 domain-containing protein n=1 Tax=Ruania halotolerans TaxID=2897773 RepID=UPI001E2D327F|nr:DUF5709 domain-containing protein [Ruania halotolerans]UFU05718.1 DUF5709 domain-containing protein [Ruania halotolerans]